MSPLRRINSLNSSKMISVEEARKILAAHFKVGVPTSITIRQSLGSVVAEDIYSPIPVPSFDNSAMDGYAMKFDGNRQKWKVTSLVRAGDTTETLLAEAEAARIFTGAKIPRGADTVIPQELVTYDPNSKIVKYEHEKITTGSNVRLKGSQCQKGDLILSKGTRITPGIVGLLASVGLSQVKVYPAPSVGYVITGDELKELGSPLREGEIYNSNGPMLEAMLQHVGIKEITPYRVPDDKEQLQSVIGTALEKQEVLVLSGGISVGDYDFVRECLESAGVVELIYKVKQRPGKPFYAGNKAEKWVFALPGNPASVLSCFNQFVKPCLRHLMGEQQVWSPDLYLPLKNDQPKKPGFTFFMKALVSDMEVEVLGGQQSFNLQAFNLANCLVELEEEKELLRAGTLVPVYYL